MTDYSTTSATARYFQWRSRWFRVDVTEGPKGGWDVVLRLDGTWTNREDADGMALFTATQIADALTADGIECPPGAFLADTVRRALIAEETH